MSQRSRYEIGMSSISIPTSGKMDGKWEIWLSLIEKKLVTFDALSLVCLPVFILYVLNKYHKKLMPSDLPSPLLYHVHFPQNKQVFVVRKKILNLYLLATFSLLKHLLFAIKFNRQVSWGYLPYWWDSLVHVTREKPSQNSPKFEKVSKKGMVMSSHGASEYRLVAHIQFLLLWQNVPKMALLVSNCFCPLCRHNIITRLQLRTINIWCLCC